MEIGLALLGPGASRILGERQEVVVVRRVHLVRDPDLTRVRQTGRLLGGGLGLGEDGEQEGGEDRDDGGDDEQFD